MTERQNELTDLQKQILKAAEEAEGSLWMKVPAKVGDERFDILPKALKVTKEGVDIRILLDLGENPLDQQTEDAILALGSQISGMANAEIKFLETL